jgi:phosphoglycolate phosphatase
MGNNQKPLLMFDFDGVIIDSLDGFHGAWAKACEEAGFTAASNRETYLSVFETNMFEGLVRIGIPQERIPEILHSAEKNLHKASIQMHLFDGAKEMLQELNRVFPLFIITSSVGAIVRNIIAANSVTPIPEILGSEVDTSKIRKIASTIKQYPSHRPFYIGDTVGDIIEGKAAGATTIGVTWGWHGRQTLEKVSPDYLFDSPKKLSDFVRNVR